MCSIMEKMVVFFGYVDIGFCLKVIDDDENSVLFNCVFNFLSYGKYVIYELIFMGEDN